MEDSLAVTKYKMCKTFDMADFLLGSCPTEIPARVECPSNKVFIIELFLIAKNLM